MNHMKAGFINLLFEDESQHHKRRQGEEGELDTKPIGRIMEDNAFLPRNRIKNMRKLRASDAICIHGEEQPASKRLKKMFVDGSHLKEFLPRRQLVTQHFGRPMEKDRMLYSPTATQRQYHQTPRGWAEGTTSFCWQRDESSQQAKYPSEIEENSFTTRQFQTVKIIKKNEFLSLDNSTNSSSNRNIRGGTSVRYRRIMHNDRKIWSNSKDTRLEAHPKATLELKKELVKAYSNPFGSPENISAKAYIVIEHFHTQKHQNSGRCLQAASNSKLNLQIASLTKIMTCILTIELCDKYKVDIKSQEISIGTFQTRIEGTSASLRVGEVYTVEQLFYGLMLPSGNDASLVLSVFCGQLIEKGKRESHKGPEMGSQLNCKKAYYRNFILEMNRKSLHLQMKRTFFTNSHGLSNNLNKSCASDIALLIDYALRNNQFRAIVGTREYECSIGDVTEVKQGRNSSVARRKVRWQNTHRLVQSKPDLYKGIKTGITQSAGPCLASLVAVGNRQFIVVVLGSRSQKWRYRDTQQLEEWLLKKGGLVSG